MSAPKVRHRLEYAGYRAGTRLLRLLPERAANAFGGAAGSAAGGLFRVRRDLVQRHLERAFPGLSSAERARVARESYRHVGREGIATFRFRHLARAEIEARTEVVGLDRVRAAVEEGTGAVVVSGHFGNWEIGGGALAVRGVPFAAVALRQANPLFDRDIRAVRAHLGITLIERKGAPKAIAEALSNGSVVGIVGDQDARSSGIFVDFFGIPSSTARGPAVLALRSGAPLFVGSSFRLPGAEMRYRVVLEEVRVDRSGPVSEVVHALTQGHTSVLERHIRQAPEQYLWLHRRWKTKPGKP